MEPVKSPNLVISYEKAPTAGISLQSHSSWYRVGIAFNIGSAVVGLVLLPLGFFEVFEGKVVIHGVFLFAQIMLTLASLMGVHVHDWRHRRRMLYFTIAALVIAVLGTVPAIIYIVRIHL